MNERRFFMGLDMYMRKIAKLSDNDVEYLTGKHVSIIYTPGCNYTYMHKEDFDSEPDMYADLLPFVSEIKMLDTFFDWKKCWKDHDVDELDDRRGSYHGPNGVGYSFASGKRIDMTPEEYDSYCYDGETIVYVWSSEEVDYWRKYYDLLDKIEQVRMRHKIKEAELANRTLSKEEISHLIIENCGYYELSLEERKEIRNFLLERNDDDANKDYWYEEDDHIFFTAWW
jgi:hypothetical protein